MALRITKATDPITVEQIIVTAYSPPGVGKTSLGYTADAPLLLDFDGGAYRAANRGDTVQVKSWEDAATITADDLKDYRTLVTDTAGRALDFLAGDIIAKNPKLGRGGALTLQGFGELKAKFIAWTKLVRSFGLDLVLLVHADEQRSGDDVIERLDAQGASKNEIYKVSDLMGRIKMEAGGKRTLNFDPTDTAFGKNPASFPKLDVPDFATAPHFLAGIIAETKARLNQLTAAQQQAGQELAFWQAEIGKAEDGETFNALIPLIAEKASAATAVNAKRLLVKAAKEKGLVFDKETKLFATKATAA